MQGGACKARGRHESINAILFLFQRDSSKRCLAIELVAITLELFTYYNEAIYKFACQAKFHIVVVLIGEDKR